MKKEDVAKLKALIDYHDNLYYNEDDPEISDEEYDALKEQYYKLSGTTQDDEVYVPGKVKSDLKKVPHTYPIKSLEKVMEEKEVRAAIERLLPIVIEPKFDGLTVIGYPPTDFKAGVFATRSDGFEGEDITATAIRIEGINRVNHVPGIVRMEAYMPLSVFKTINEELIAAGEKPFKNARNAAAGMLRRLKDPSKVRGIHYFAYNLVGSVESETTQLERLSCNGFNVTPHWEFDNVDDAYDFIMNFDRKSLDYEIDGLVIKSNLPDSLAKFGETGHHPKNAIAYKFPSEGQWTKLISITWGVGRTGKVTPVANFESVDILGSTISNATLHNMGIIEALGLTFGAEVFVIKSKDVIPAIIKCRKQTMFRIDVPTKCPVCDMPLVLVNDQHFCTNQFCSAKRVARLVHLASRDALNIEGLSEATAEKMFTEGLIEEPFDVFKLTAEQIESLTGFAKRSAEKLYEAIQSVAHPEFNRFIYAAGIPGVGRTMSRDIAAKFGTFEAWTLDAVNGFELTKTIEGVGDVAIFNLVKYGYLLGELSQYLTPKATQKKAEPKSGKVLTFVITGTLEHPRSYYEKLITDAGHKCSGSVSAKTSFVLVGEEAGGKLTKAIELGFEEQGKILRTEEELKSKL